ncbi:AI-2E family transporter [Kangiella profundi]|uniref:AI-2E family transporter n=1 Tax=Kangiella profundi TaxID=1561924 RepID=A0A2K9A782_9GAMM|nr:AI-2E family transporter [Kangiella profundi]AUD78590.1 AI-2E family transporter [Kangiella profundi]MBD3667948.1 AI-2E family transporter [Kangiella sp.]GGF09230.1 AI-2E family transporter [Kangiella profundi]
MTTIFTRWFKRNFSSPATIVLSMLLIVGFFIILTVGDILAPILWALVFAYLLESVVSIMRRKGVPRIWAVLVVFAGFIGLALIILFGLIPLIWEQGAKLFAELPNIMTKVRESILELPEKYPNFVSTEQVSAFFASLNSELAKWGEAILTASVSSLMSVATLMVYIILVPLLVFFFLKDRRQIISWCTQWLPQERHLAEAVWSEVNQQIGNYIRGKVLEIVIVGTASYIAFLIMGLNYALLLGVCVGLSVLIPYIGAALVTIPVALIAFFQWGFTHDFYILMIVYLIIQILDGNLLVPLIFSEAVNLHPVAIIGSILLFGGLWGFWGVFFAIPLAILVNAVLSALKGHKLQLHDEGQSNESPVQKSLEAPEPAESE